MRKKGRSCGIGGQAVLEGVMMKNKDVYAVSVRKPDGQIVTDTEEFGGVMKGSVWKRLPFVRGVFNFVDSMILGMRTLNWSVSFYEEEEEAEKEKPSLFQRLFGDKADSVVMGITTVFSMVLAVLIFMMLPYFISGFLSGYIRNASLTVIIEGLIRILIFLLYVTGISVMKDIRRLYQYHGAEHKCINCIERGRPLTVKNVMRCSRQHRRCGTSFLLFVMFVSVVLFFFIRVENSLYRAGLRILLIPVIAGISYEIIRLAGNSNNILIRILSAPGMWLQKLTTKEPDEDMVEVAIASVEAIFDWKAYLKDTFGYVVDDTDTDDVNTDPSQWEGLIIEETGEREEVSVEERGAWEEEPARESGAWEKESAEGSGEWEEEPAEESGEREEEPARESGAWEKESAEESGEWEEEPAEESGAWEEEPARESGEREEEPARESGEWEEEPAEENGEWEEELTEESGAWEEEPAEESGEWEEELTEESGAWEEEFSEKGGVWVDSVGESGRWRETAAGVSSGQESCEAVADGQAEEAAVGVQAQEKEPAAGAYDQCEKPFVIRGGRCEEPAVTENGQWEDSDSTDCDQWEESDSADCDQWKDSDSADDDQWEESLVEAGVQYGNAAKVPVTAPNGPVVEEYRPDEEAEMNAFWMEENELDGFQWMDGDGDLTPAGELKQDAGQKNG